MFRQTASRLSQSLARGVQARPLMSPYVSPLGARRLDFFARSLTARSHLACRRRSRCAS